MQDLSYTYHNGTAVFANASIEAYPHEIVALVGPCLLYTSRCV